MYIHKSIYLNLGEKQFGVFVSEAQILDLSNEVIWRTLLRYLTDVYLYFLYHC